MKKQHLLLGGAAILIIAGLITRKQNTTNNTNNTNNSNMKLPRGYRNNNPLNIRISTYNQWQGKVTNNTDGTFEQFTAMKYGYRAAFILLRNYITNYNLYTIDDLIRRWAPANENNTEGYISTVCKLTGFYPSTVINPNDPKQMQTLVYAMSIVENTSVPAPDETAIAEGWTLYAQQYNL